MAFVPLAVAQAAETPAAPDWSLGLYAEADGEGGVGLAGNVSWYASTRTEWFLAAYYADASDTLSVLSTRGLEIGGRHDFGPVGFELSYTGWQDPDLVTPLSEGILRRVGSVTPCREPPAAR